MSAPKYIVQANRQSDGEVMHERNASWCIAFVRYKEPTAAYNPGNSRAEVKPILVIENDCLAVTVTNSKSSFGKNASMTFRAGEVFYPGAVAPGDWCFIWMSDYQDDIDKIIDSLNALNAGRTPSTPLSNWFSGLKFAGRVTEAGFNDAVSGNGIRPYVQTIQAQAFLEFASSIYYTEMAQYIFTQSFGNQDTGVGVLQQNGLETALHDMAGKFVRFFTNTDTFVQLYPPPDIAIAFYMVITMGINAADAVAGINLPNIGVLNDAIEVPAVVAKILGKPGATKLWQLLNVYLGVQQYQTDSNTPWENFAPVADVFPNEINPVFFKTPTRLKGWVPFYPVPWDNKSLWSVLNQYLNPCLNELYTVLRCDEFGFIRPTVVAREQPFGTQLFNHLQNKKILPIAPVDASQQGSRPLSLQISGQNQPQLNQSQVSQQLQTQYQKFAGESAFNHGDEEVRGRFDTHPRWVIDESMIRGVNLATYEQDRVNFVQVWGRNSFNTIGPPGLNQASIVELDKEAQLSGGNMVSDDQDIKRNGLRANVVESPFDYPVPLNSRASYWARIRADWLFNGHMKARGTITCNGIREPICEGDNTQVRGVVLHIQDVVHTGQIEGGVKSFTTTLTVLNGILANSLDNNQIPSYIYHQGPSADKQQYIPGTTDIQHTTKSNRDFDGERGNGETESGGSA